MLNINVNFNVEKDPTYPVYFTNNTCVNCGAEGSLVMIDIFGRETKQEIHPFDHILCKKCNAKYSIEWMKNPETGKMKAIPSDPSLVKDFFNIIKSKKIKEEGINTVIG